MRGRERFEPIETEIGTAPHSKHDLGDGLTAVFYPVKSGVLCYCIAGTQNRASRWVSVLERLHRDGVRWCKAKVARVDDIVAHDPVFNRAKFSIVSLIVSRVYAGER